MITKTIILGGAPRKLESPRPIEFVRYVNISHKKTNYDCNLDIPLTPPRNWAYIELIAKNYDMAGLYLMFAYDDPSGRSGLYMSAIGTTG